MKASGLNAYCPEWQRSKSMGLRIFSLWMGEAQTAPWNWLRCSRSKYGGFWSRRVRESEALNCSALMRLRLTRAIRALSPLTAMIKMIRKQFRALSARLKMGWILYTLHPGRHRRKYAEIARFRNPLYSCSTVESRLRL